VRTGRRLAIDVGKVRIGVAASDFHAILASGLETIQRTDDLPKSLDVLVALITDVEPIEIYVGLPISMSGKNTQSTLDAVVLAKSLAAKVSVPIRFIDERLSTVAAANALRASGKDSKSGRMVIDQIAATVILEQALDTEKLTGLVPGTALEDFDE
jgi:putative Holliday junction resolvase